MWKKTAIITIVLGLAVIFSFIGFGIWHTTSQTPSFDAGGYILQSESEEVKSLFFQAGESYTNTLSGGISFTDSAGNEEIVSRDSFVHFDDNSVMALNDGVLLDFEDLSENFINNYLISAELNITEAGGVYTAETTSGTIQFGENLWKLSDKNYMIQSPTLKVCLAEDDIREVNDYIQILVTDDQIVYLMTQDNLWMTISEDCYIETAGGVQIYPVRQLVDDGTYKLSLAKISVSTEDAIVLTEDETRRQIVPELNIEAIDGADGKNGDNGQLGEDGTDGESGEAGIDGEDGEDGQAGSIGEDGEDGSSGTNGTSGKFGTSGESGADGSDGKNGGNGSAGKDAVTESSTNSALPTMSITDWQISATGLKGTISVSDPGSFLSGIGEIDDFQTKYPGKVTITNVSTGAVIACYEARYNQETETYTILDSEMDSFTGFYQGTEEVSFATKDELEPDTQYRLSVTAYYKATDHTNLIYSREFISRTFYTDSTGVYLSANGATQDSVTVTASLSSDYANSLAGATVYLLTPGQDESFTASSLSNVTSYTGSQVLSFDDRLSKDVVFTGLTPNTSYIARVYVETNSDLKTLTSQKLELKTLKRIPTTEEGAVPTVSYNRVTGAFEVYRPTVTDEDGGAVEYVYTAYRLNGSEWVEVSSRTITPSSSEPVEFHLQSGETYRFGVKLEFDDNEKTVYYDLGLSSEIKAEGDSMPKLTLTAEESGVDFNKYNGTLRVSLGSNSSITVNQTHPLRLEFYANQIQDESVTLTDGNPVTETNRYTITLNDYVTKNTNQLDVSLQLENLYRNTNYNITVYGYLNVGDGNDEVSRAIGTVSFRTYNTLTLNAAWSTTSDSSTSISRTLSLSVQDSLATDTRSSYAIEELQDGQVTVELFSGTGVGKLRIAQKNFNEDDDLNKLFSPDGLEITEDSFGGPQLSSSGSYTLTVTAVTDRSYGMTELGYVNSFDSILNASEVVVAEPTPPDLLADSSQGVIAEPIYNENAVTYGGKVDDTLPDDAIVGYTLESTYDNVQRIGKSITYYAFEYKTFFNALATQDPLQVDGAPLMKMTLPIDSGSDAVPKVAVLFGGTKSDTGTYANGYYTYFTGEANLAGGSLVSGMGRGYRYIFAYTVEYSAGSTGEGEVIKTYPYDHREYSNYNKLYGGVKENGVRIGNGVAYILNSGMCEAPSVMPDFHTYVYSSSQDMIASVAATTATGNVTIHYTWRDPDKLINTDGTDSNNTKLIWEDSGSDKTFSQKIQQDSVSDGAGWYSAKITYTITKGSSTVLEPAVDISEYKVDYTSVLSRFNIEADAKSYEICKVPVEWSWGKQFTMSGYDSITLTMEPNYKENYIAFRFDETDAASKALISRAVAIRLIFQTADGNNEKEILLPLISEVGTKYVKLATGLLGTEYLGKEFVVTEAAMLYDTGVQGWQIPEQSGNRFALQYKNNSNSPEEFSASDYIGATSLDNAPANGALLALGNSTSFSCAKLRSAIAKKADDDAKITLSTYNLVTPTNGYYRYLYPTRMGVDASNSMSLSQLSEQYLVPKEIGEYSLKFTYGNNKGTLTEMTPSIEEPDFDVSSTQIAISDINVSGFTEEGGTIYVAAYKDRESAETLGAGYVAQKEIKIGSKGKPGEESTITLDGLEGKIRYYLAFFYKKDDQTVLLMDANTAGTAIYEVVTSDKAIINVTDLEYRNDSYFDKALDVEFSINRVFNLTMTYDIYASEADAAGENAEPVLSNNQMDTGDENDILNAPTVLSYQNKVSVNLSPSAARSILKPGTTYYFKISAWEPNGSEAGTAVVPFTITAIGNYDALIYVRDAGKDSITFQVTINDPQFSLMGRTGGSENGAALYAVRFTDGDGNVLKTSYDNQVYSASELRKEFVLNDASLLNDDYKLEINAQMKENTAYCLNVYAVPDVDHDGQITLGEQTLGWESFFDKTVSALKDCGKGLLDTINNFWNTNTYSSSDTKEKQLLIAQKMQSTLPKEGWILNEDGVYSSRHDPTTIRIQLDESVGLLGTEPVFKQIDWYVSGRTMDGTPVNVSGQSLYSKGDSLLQARDGSDGYSGYYYDIPCELGQGVYTIVLQFRTTEGAEAPTRTITIRSGV